MQKTAKFWLPAAFLGLLLAAYFFVFWRKALEIGWKETADWGHILAVPLVSGWWLWSLTPRVRTLPSRPDWRGFPLLILGLFAYAAGLFPIQNGMLEGAAAVMSLIGLTWLVLGPARLKPLLPPLLFLLFAIRISDRLWELLTARLQDLAAAGAAVVLKICALAVDFDVAIEGNIIRLYHHGASHQLNVAEACSGIRSLMAFLALGFLLAWLPPGKLPWQRIGLMLLSMPVAIVVNIGRVTVLGLLTLVNPNLAKGDFHLLVGILMLVPAAGLLLGCGWVMDRLIVRSEEPRNPDRKGGDACASTHANIALSPPLRSGFLGRAFALGATPALLGTLLWIASLKLPALFGLSTLASIGACGGLFLVLVGAFALFLKPFLARAVQPAACAFCIALGCLTASLAGQHLVVALTRAVLVKEPLDLRRDLHALPQQLGAWVMEREEPPESAEVEHALGTQNYITRWYKRPDGRRARLHIAYYAGSVDTVPHVPDRCFVAAGATPLGTTQVTLQAAGRSLPATFFQYQSTGNQKSGILYFFSANGRFLATPDQVRLQGFNLTDRYGYYCKIEMEFPGLSEEAPITAVAEDFMREALPEVLNCLPLWPPAKPR